MYTNISSVVAHAVNAMVRNASVKEKLVRQKLLLTQEVILTSEEYRKQPMKMKFLKQKTKLD